MKFHDFSPRMIDEDGTPFAGISYHPTARDIVGDGEALRTTVLDSEHLRPDKVAKRLWGLQDASWILDAINGFDNGIREYARGAEVSYVSLKRLRNIGLV